MKGPYPKSAGRERPTTTTISITIGLKRPRIYLNKNPYEDKGLPQHKKSKTSKSKILPNYRGLFFTPKEK